MGKATIGGKIVLEGEKEYRDALKNIKSDQSELRSEMKLCQSTFKESQNSLEALNKKYEILTKQVSAQTQKVEVYQNAMETSVKKEEQAAEKVEELRTALVNAEKKMQSMADTSEEGSQAIEEQAKAVEELKQKLALAEDGYSKAQQKTKGYQTAVNNAAAELQEMRGELSKTEQYMNEAENATDKCAKSIDEYGKETENATGKTSIFGDVLKANLMSDALKAGVQELAEGIKKIATEATEAGSSFEASMSQVAATMGMTAKEIENGSEDFLMLSEAAKKCGKETMFSATEAGEALNYLALAGYDAKKSAETLPKVLDLAAAGGLDLAYASDLVTDSMAALGMETSELNNYIDEMAKTSQKSNTSVAQLGEATLVCAGTVALAGQSIETMNTELGVLANNGIKGAEGGTHLRNVILSLSAPTETAEKAIEKLGIRVADSQGNMRDLNDIMIELNAATERMSSTEKTQIISKIFNKTDIAAVNALLKGTGTEFNSLNKEIENCSGAAKTMADTMNNNLKGKVTILQSALEGLGISAYEIFDDNMKKAVDSATNAVGNLQKSIDNGKLGVSLNKMSKAMGEFSEKAVDASEDALPGVIDGFTWILENGDIIASVITGITAAQIEMAVAPKIIQTVSSAWQGYQLVTQGAATWQEVLNLSMAANPAGLLITAITGLTAAVGAYILINKDNVITTDEVTRATNEQIEAANKLSEQHAASVQERSIARQGMEDEARLCQNLAKELVTLQGKTALTASEQARQSAIVQQLNQAVPELNLAIDAQSGKLNMTNQELMKNVELMMEMAKAEAARKDMMEIAEQQYEAEKQLADLQEQLKEQKEQVTEAQNAYNESIEKECELNGQRTERYAAVGTAEEIALQQATAAQEALEQQIADTETSISGFTEEYETAMNFISETDALVAASEATGTLGNAAEAAAGQMVTMSEEARQAYAEMTEDIYELVTNQISLFSEFGGAAELSTQQLLSNMQSQVEGITHWSDNLLLLADRGINQGLLKMLSDMGPEGAGYVATFVEMSEEELQKANELFEQSLILPQDTTDKVMAAYAEAGKQAVEGFGSGIEKSTESIAVAIDQMTQESLEKMKENLDMEDESGESKKTHEIGESIDKGVGSGITDGKQELLDTVSILTAEVIKTSQNGLQMTTFQTMGKQVTQGLEKGIRDGKSGVISAIVDLCTSAISAAKETLDIHSPSRPFTYMGEMSGEGYIVGWKKKMAGIDAIIEESLPETSIGNIGNYTDTIRNENSEIVRNGMEHESSLLNMEYADVIAGAISNAIDGINIKVFMEGDSEGIFKMVRTETEKFVTATGYNPLTQKEDK